MLILFDGVCNLCAWSVRFIIEHDPRTVFRFAALQSDLGRQLMIQHGLDPEAMNSFVLIQNDKAHTESSAALHVARKLTWPWSWAYAFILLPKPFRDAVYRFISRHRYRWFGRADSCLMPTPELRARFVD